MDFTLTTPFKKEKDNEEFDLLLIFDRSAGLPASGHASRVGVYTELPEAPHGPRRA